METRRWSIFQAVMCKCCSNPVDKANYTNWGQGIKYLFRRVLIPCTDYSNENLFSMISSIFVARFTILKHGSILSYTQNSLTDFLTFLQATTQKADETGESYDHLLVRKVNGWGVLLMIIATLFRLSKVSNFTVSRSKYSTTKQFLELASRSDSWISSYHGTEKTKTTSF